MIVELRLAKWGWGDGDFGTHKSSTIYADQFWRLDSDGNGHFYVVNAEYDLARVSKLGRGDEQTGTYYENIYNDQLWSFLETSPGEFKICNKVSVINSYLRQAVQANRSII